MRSLVLLPPTQPSHQKGNGTSQDELDPLFLSTSNDPTLLVNSLSPNARPPNQPTNGGEPVRILEGHTSIVYECRLCPAPFSSSFSTSPKEREASRVVTSSEDGTLRWWDWTVPHSDSASALVETVEMPVESVWCVACLPLSGDVVAGGSDGVVRVYSSSSAEHTTEEDQEIGEGQGEGVPSEAERQEEESLVEEVARKKGRRGGG